MTKIRNLEWLRDGVDRKLNMDRSQPDQALTGTTDDEYDQVDEALNEAAENLLEDIRVKIDPTLLLEFDTYTWPSDQLTFELPPQITSDALYAIEDITDADPGTFLYIFDRGMDYHPTVFWLRSNTLQWGTSGAPSEKSLRFFYYPLAQDMKKPGDEPTGIPPRYRRLLIQDAAISLREDMEDTAPTAWYNRRNRMWDRMLIGMSEGRPVLGNRARIFLDSVEGDFI
jgi:hypothetical protein